MSRPTRKQVAAELLRMLERGPSISTIGSPDGRLLASEAEARCKSWLDSWITPKVKALVPELKPSKTPPTTEATP